MNKNMKNLNLIALLLCGYFHACNKHSYTIYHKATPGKDGHAEVVDIIYFNKVPQTFVFNKSKGMDKLQPNITTVNEGGSRQHVISASLLNKNGDSINILGANRAYFLLEGKLHGEHVINDGHARILEDKVMKNGLFYDECFKQYDK